MKKVFWFICPTGAKPYMSSRGKTEWFSPLGSSPNTYSCSPYWRHSIMHLINGVPISSPASLSVGHVQKRVTRKRDSAPGKVFGSLRHSAHIAIFYGP